MFVPTFSHVVPLLVVLIILAPDAQAHTTLSLTAETENNVKGTPEFCSVHCAYDNSVKQNVSIKQNKNPARVPEEFFI
jgi:hypothetical protein